MAADDKYKSVLGRRTKSDLVREVVQNKPDLLNSPTGGVGVLTRYMMSEYPKVFGLFSDVKARQLARRAVGYAIGQRGKDSRAINRNKKLRQKLDLDNTLETTPGNPDSFRLPDTSHFLLDVYGNVQATKPFIIDTANILIGSDVHSPYFDPKALKSFFFFGKDLGSKLECILLNGDWIDCHQASFWLRTPTKARLKEERDVWFQIAKEMRKEFPNVRIIFKLGNHEKRIATRILERAPEYADFDELRFDNLFQLSRFGIEYVEEYRPMRFGKLWIIHGHEYKRSFFNPVNAARGLFLRTKGTNVLAGHVHTVSEHTETRLSGEEIGAWSIGCLCLLNADYAPHWYNNWQHGFAYVERLDPVGNFRVQNLKIINGHIV